MLHYLFEKFVGQAIYMYVRIQYLCMYGLFKDGTASVIALLAFWKFGG